MEAIRGRRAQSKPALDLLTLGDERAPPIERPISVHTVIAPPTTIPPTANT